MGLFGPSTRSVKASTARSNNSLESDHAHSKKYDKKGNAETKRKRAANAKQRAKEKKKGDNYWG